MMSRRALMLGVMVIKVAKRGTYCEVVVPANTYSKAHGCLIVHGLRRVGDRYLCSRHQRKAGR